MTRDDAPDLFAREKLAMPWQSVICTAIRERLLLAFDYDGHARVVGPYCHGLSRSGEVMRAVQVRGSSHSGGLGFGKLWLVARIGDLRLTGERFVPDDPNYNPNDRGMLQIHCRI